MTGNPDVRTTVRTIRAGAEDFLSKPISSDELLHTVGRAIARHELARSSRIELDAVHARIARLTPREREVFDLIISGHTTKQAARTLGCTERTIKAHRQRVMEKIEVKTLAKLVAFAQRLQECGSDVR